MDDVDRFFAAWRKGYAAYSAHVPVESPDAMLDFVNDLADAVAELLDVAAAMCRYSYAPMPEETIRRTIEKEVEDTEREYRTRQASRAPGTSSDKVLGDMLSERFRAFHGSVGRCLVRAAEAIRGDGGVPIMTGLKEACAIGERLVVEQNRLHTIIEQGPLIAAQWHMDQKR